MTRYLLRDICSLRSRYLSLTLLASRNLVFVLGSLFYCLFWILHRYAMQRSMLFNQCETIDSYYFPIGEGSL